MRALAILTVRNEAAFLLDWLAPHRATGFTDFLVYSNDCTDGTDHLLDRLQALGVLTHVRNDPPYEGGIQWSALKHAARHPLVKAADWILPLDVDEFVNIHTGDHTLTALLAALPDADAITLTWRLFGNAGQARYLDVPVTEAFTRAAPVIMNWPWRAAMFKTLYRNSGIYRKPGVHRPRDPDPSRVETARWFDGSGRELDPQFRHRRLFSPYGRNNYGLVQMNHYALGSMESYVLKCDRGRAVHGADKLGMDYWVERNFGTDEDTSISALAARTAQQRALLAADPETAALHKAGVAWRHARFDQLMQQEPFRALFGRLLMTPPSSPVSKQSAAFLYHFTQKGRQSAEAQAESNEDSNST